MAASTRTRRPQVHLIEGTPWKDALISFLEPRSPYRPWRIGSVIAKGDTIIAVLDTEPRTVLTSARVAVDGDIMAALAEVDHRRTRGLMEDWESEFGNLERVLRPGRLLPNTAKDCVDALGQGILDGYKDRMGHGSAIAARVLLESGGHCTGCDTRLPLDREDAVDQVHIRTTEGDDTVVGPTLEPDWPATLCTPCHTTMLRVEFDTFLDYRFAKNGPCPRCHARRAFLKVPPLLNDHDFENLPPWQMPMGTDGVNRGWFCEQCHHEW